MTETANDRIRVEAPADRCWDVAIDFESYPEWVRDVKEVHTIERDPEGRGKRVEYRAAALGKSIRYTLDYDWSEAPRAFTWTLVEGEMLRALDGRYEFAPDDASGRAGTLVTYDLRIDLSLPMPGMVKRRAGALIVHNALQELKRAAEGT